MTRSLRPWAALLSILLPWSALAQSPPHEEGARDWAFYASLGWYFVPNQTDYPQPSVTADHGPVHLEIRYNYEALRTVSLFVGWNFEFGETVTFGVTPIVGSMLGEAGGPVLGLELSIRWGPLSFSSEGEWVTDRHGGTGGFLYAWSELDVRPWEWLRAGMVVQRTRVFHTAREVVLGPLLGVTVWKLDFTAYWFQPGGVDSFAVASIGVSF